MMKEQLITFETAKLAKEKGFVINPTSCTMYYVSNGKLADSYYDFDDFCLAPTQSLLQKWLREKHNIDVDIWCNASGWAFNLNKTNGTTIYSYDYYFGNIDSGMFNSYEEALEKGLQEALKLKLLGI